MTSQDDGANSTAVPLGTTVNYEDYESWTDTNFGICDSTGVRDFAKVFLPTLYSVVFILGFIGNGLVVCVLIKHRSQTNLTDICLLNLALSDLLFVLTLPLYSHYNLSSSWTFGDFMCHLTTGFHSTGFFSSIFFMVVMTLDRYVVIMHAHRVARYRTVTTGIVLTVVVWMLSLSISLPEIIFTRVTNESEGVACSANQDSYAWRVYSLFATNVLGLLIPLLVMVLCYTRIIPTLVKMRGTKKHRVVKLIIAIVVAFFLFWAPYNITLLLRFLKGGLQGDECAVDTNLRFSVTVTETFAYTHCCLNPFIYAFVGQKFTRRAVQMLRQWIPLPFTTDMSESTYRKSSIVSRSTSTFAM